MAGISAGSLTLVDSFGVGASILCAIHCFLMPVIIGFLPIIGMQWLDGPYAHEILALSVVIFALAGLIPGYMKHHNRWIVTTMTFGLSLVLFATFCTGESSELPIITIGNLFVIAAHILNQRKLHHRTHKFIVSRGEKLS